MRAREHARAALTTALCALCVLTAGNGCGSDDEVEAPLHTRCDLPRSGSQLQGEWTLRARGERRECEQRGFEGELVIETSMPVAVSAEPQSSSGPSTAPAPSAIADAFVQRIELADYLLGLDDSAPTALNLAGGTVGSCVSFTFSEDLGANDALVYEFDGAITDVGFAEGEFTGEGPAGCRVEGTFELEIR